MPNVSRRDFLKYCGIGAGALGLSMTDLGLLQKALANPSGPAVIWLAGHRLHRLFGIFSKQDFHIRSPDGRQCSD